MGLGTKICNYTDSFILLTFEREKSEEAYGKEAAKLRTGIEYGWELSDLSSLLFCVSAQSEFSESL